MKSIEPLLIALQFLTRLPVRLRGAPDERAVGRSLICYPLVGLLLGLLLAGFAWTLADAPALLRAALVLAAWVAITGALHLDGLADSADAWIGGHGDRVKTLRIMKDPNCGPMGAAALVLVLLIKLAALDTLMARGDVLVLVLAPLTGRTALPLLLLTTPYVRPGGLGAALSARLPRRGAIAVVSLTCAAVPLAAGIRGLAVLAAAAAVFLLLRALMLRRIRGTTGDTAGALTELTETAVLVTATLSLPD